MAHGSGRPHDHHVGVTFVSDPAELAYRFTHPQFLFDPVPRPLDDKHGLGEDDGLLLRLDVRRAQTPSPPQIGTSGRLTCTTINNAPLRPATPAA